MRMMGEVLSYMGGNLYYRSGDCAEPGLGVATGLTYSHVTTSSSKMDMV